MPANNTPGFTLSLDCEGLWGMADNEKIIKAGIINDASLKNAYAFITDTLNKNSLKATAAFVTCFAAEPDTVHSNMELIEQMAELNTVWFLHLLPVLHSTAMDGWIGSAFYRLMPSAGHDIPAFVGSDGHRGVSFRDGTNIQVVYQQITGAQ